MYNATKGKLIRCCSARAIFEQSGERTQQASAREREKEMSKLSNTNSQIQEGSMLDRVQALTLPVHGGRSNEKEKKIFDLEGYTTEHATYITHTRTRTGKGREERQWKKRRERQGEIVVEEKKERDKRFSCRSSR